MEHTLKLDLILDNKRLALGVNLLSELGGDGVVSGRVLDNQALVTFHALEDVRLLNSPLANIGPLLILIRVLCVLLGVGRLPSRLPVIGELLKERSLEGSGL